MSCRSPIVAATELRESAGGKNTIVLSLWRPYCERNDSMNSRAVVGPLFIFQFAAKIGAITQHPSRRALRRPEVFSPREIPATRRHRWKRGSCDRRASRVQQLPLNLRRRRSSLRRALSQRALLQQLPWSLYRTEGSRKLPWVRSRSRSAPTQSLSRTTPLFWAQYRRLLHVASHHHAKRRAPI